MRRALALPALALACLASRAASLGSSPSASLPRPEEVYAPLLAGASRHAVGGYVTPDGFAPLKPSEARPARPRRHARCAHALTRPRTLSFPQVLVSLTVAGVHRRVTRPLPDNSWAFKDVPPGTHVLEVVADGAPRGPAPAAAASALSSALQSLRAAPSTLGRPRLFWRSRAPLPGFEVPVVRVDVGAEDGRVRFARADAPARSLRAPLVLGPVARVAYVIPVQPWSLRSLLANPMYLIMGLMAVMMFLMPRLMENIDPDVRTERSMLCVACISRVARAGAEADAGADGQGRHAGASAGAPCAADASCLLCRLAACVAACSRGCLRSRGR